MNSVRDMSVGQIIGVAAGAYVGGALGSEIGGGLGRLVSTSVGVVVGASGGYAVGFLLDPSDMAFYNGNAQKTLSTENDGVITNWSNPKSGNGGIFRATRSYITGDGQIRMLIFVEYTLAMLTGGYLLATGALYVFQRKLLYSPDISVPNLAGSGLAGIKEVTVETDDALNLLSWYSEPCPGMPTVLYFQGNAGHIGSRVEKIRPFIDAGYGVLLAGYRGYGGNIGNPSEEGLYRDARAAVGFLDRRGTSAANIVVYGESLGTAVAVRMAVELATGTKEGRGGVRALVLEAPFPSVVEAASYFYPVFPVKWLLKDRFDSGAIIGRVKAPVFIFHGDKDQTMPIHFGKKLCDLAVQPKECLWVAGAGHSDLFDFGAANAVLEFLARQR